MSALLQQFSDALADTFIRVQRGLVQLDDGQGSTGAGTIWRQDGLIITNAHVVMDYERRGGDPWYQPAGNPRTLFATLADGQRLPVQVLAVDEAQDLAALQVEATGLEALQPGDSRALRPGQWVMAVGHPWGVRDAVTAGVVIGPSGDLPEMQTGREWLALNLRLRPGHSGGPLVDSGGRLVGINTLITGPEVGFAIPVHSVQNFLVESFGSDDERAAPPTVARAASIV